MKPLIYPPIDWCISEQTTVSVWLSELVANIGIFIYKPILWPVPSGHVESWVLIHADQATSQPGLQRIWMKGGTEVPPTSLHGSSIQKLTLQAHLTEPCRIVIINKIVVLFKQCFSGIVLRWHTTSPTSAKLSPACPSNFGGLVQEMAQRMLPKTPWHEQPTQGRRGCWARRPPDPG